MEKLTGKQRREHWQRIWQAAYEAIRQKGVVIEIQRGSGVVPRENPALKILEKAEREIVRLEKEYGAEDEEIPQAIDPEVVLGTRKVGRSSSERRARGQSASRKRG